MEADELLSEGSKLLENELSVDVQQDNQITSVSKELFNSKKIDLKTEVSDREIKNLTRLRFLGLNYDLENVDDIIDSFLSLRVSKDRKSRSEFIAALRSEDETNQQMGFFKRMFGGNKE